MPYLAVNWATLTELYRTIINVPVICTPLSWGIEGILTFYSVKSGICPALRGHFCVKSLVKDPAPNVSYDQDVTGSIAVSVELYKALRIGTAVYLLCKTRYLSFAMPPLSQARGVVGAND